MQYFAVLVQEIQAVLCVRPTPIQEILEIPTELYIYRYRINRTVDQAMQYCLVGRKLCLYLCSLVH